MRIRILCVGKLKDGFYLKACEEYQKRLSRYANVEIIEVADEAAPERQSAAERSQTLWREGERLQRQMQSAATIALCVDGEADTSEAFAGRIAAYERGGAGCVQFLIGGSNGLDPALADAASLRLSLSSLTFPHNLARLVLLEQLYRAMKINRGETYHK
jgi:23S rRNA (pseudouridine1915-N3)-methyltransferase